MNEGIGNRTRSLGIHKSDFRNSALQNVRTFIEANEQRLKERNRGFLGQKNGIFQAKYDMAILFTLFILKVIRGV
jgi:hypothetical protein